MFQDVLGRLRKFQDETSKNVEMFQDETSKNVEMFQDVSSCFSTLRTFWDVFVRLGCFGLFQDNSGIFKDVLTRVFRNILGYFNFFFRMLRDVLVCFRMFQVILRTFQVSRDVSGCFRMFKDVLGCFRMFQDILGCFRTFHVVSQCFKIFQDV